MDSIKDIYTITEKVNAQPAHKNRRNPLEIEGIIPASYIAVT